MGVCYAREWLPRVAHGKMPAKASAAQYRTQASWGYTVRVPSGEHGHGV